MHIPDNYLSPQTDAVMAVAMVPVWAHCIKKVRAFWNIQRCIRNCFNNPRRVCFYQHMISSY